MAGKGQKGSFRASKAAVRQTTKQREIIKRKGTCKREAEAKLVPKSTLPIDAGNVSKEQQLRRLIREREHQQKDREDALTAPSPAAASLLASMRAEAKGKN